MVKIKNGLKNVIFEILYYIVNILINLITRKIIIKYIGIEAIALKHILNQIVNFLSLAELGICNIMLFNLYEPLKQQNKKRINSLMNSFKKTYKKVSFIIIFFGLLFIPLLKYFINDYNLEFNYVILYLLVIFDISITYLFSFKTYLLQADQKSYIYLIIMITCKSISFFIEIFVLIILKNYYIYYILCVISNLLMYYIISKYVEKKYNLFACENDINYNDNINKYLKNTSISKICNTLNQSVDILVLAKFASISNVGLYSNYHFILSSICNIVQKIYDSFKAIIANSLVGNTIEKTNSIFDFLHYINYIIAFLCSTFFYFFINIIITICFGEEYLLTNEISLALSIQMFITIFRINLWQFISIKGWFNISKISDLVGIILNIILSILLYLKLNIFGIIVSAIISQLVQFTIEFILILKKMNRINVKPIIKQILLILLYLFFILLIGQNILFSIIIMLLIMTSVIIYLKGSIYYVFKN